MMSTGPATSSSTSNFAELTALSLKQAAEAIKACDVLIIMAGAGLSVEGGIPDFVDIDKALPEIANLGLSVYAVSNAEIFLQKPRLAWGVFGKRMRDYRQATPHAGYTILLKWCQAKSTYWAYTSNIDRHFVRAGFPVESVIECHRSLYEFQCAVPCCDEVWDGSGVEVEYDEGTLLADSLPRCRRCNNVARPCTVLATDSRWLGTYTQLREQAMDNSLTELARTKAVVIFEIGCGVQMPKVRDKSEELISMFRGAGHNTVFVRVNPTNDHLRMPKTNHPNDIALCMSALDALRAIDGILTDIV